MSESGQVYDDTRGELLGSYRSVGPFYYWWNKKTGRGVTLNRDAARNRAFDVGGRV